MACSRSVRAWKTRSRGAAIEIWQVTASLSEPICEVGVMLSVAMRHRFLSLMVCGGSLMVCGGLLHPDEAGACFSAALANNRSLDSVSSASRTIAPLGMTICFIFYFVGFHNAKCAPVGSARTLNEP